MWCRQCFSSPTLSLYFSLHSFHMYSVFAWTKGGTKKIKVRRKENNQRTTERTNKRTNELRTNAKWKQLKMSWQSINHFRNNDLLSFYSIYLSVSHPGELWVIANMPVHDEKRKREQKIDVFPSTPKMLFNDTKCDRWCKSWHWID